jgi:hypothetical protein
LSIRKTVISAAVVIPVLAATPAMADETPTPDPTITETPSPDPTETPVADPTATPTAVPTQTPQAGATESPAATQEAAVAAQVPSAAASFQSVPVAPPAKRVRAGIRTSRAGMSMRAIGTRYTPLTAVSRLMSWARQGQRGYHNGCLRLADNAYGANNRVSTALRQWYRAKRAGYGHVNRNAPVGAQLFWRTSNPAGHIATYVGRGRVVTNVPGGRVKVVRWSTLDRWGPYLGWAEPYYG